MAPAPLDHWLCRRMGLPQAVSRPPLSAVPGRDELRRWQLARLRELVAHAQARSPFYAAHLRGVDASRLGSLEAFSSLPAITPEQVRQAPEQLLCVSQGDIARAVTLASSGTTGPPKRIFHTEADLDATREYFRWGMSAMVHAGETALVLMPGERPDGVGRLLMDALGDMGARAAAHGVMTSAEDALARCRAEKARCVVGAPAHVHLLARLWQRKQLPLGKIRSVLLCWDTIPDAIVRSVAQAFGCRVFRHWGMIETGLGGAVECEPGSGMHLRETDVYLEIIDPDTEAPLPDGEFGEMVLTTPLRLGMPLIRYRTGDRGRILPGTCRCGSPLRRLDAAVRRLEEGVHARNGRITLHELNDSLYALPDLDDFAAEFDGAVLRIRALGFDLRQEDVQAALRSIPSVKRGCAAGTLALTIDIENGGVPAVPGLGKRRIQIKTETRP